VKLDTVNEPDRVVVVPGIVVVVALVVVGDGGRVVVVALVVVVEVDVVEPIVDVVVVEVVVEDGVDATQAPFEQTYPLGQSTCKLQLTPSGPQP